MKNFLYTLLLSSACAAGVVSTALPASAQVYNGYGAPAYNQWQAAWDQDQYDRRHVILGEVVGFEPYRLQVRRHDGYVQNVDLKNGTVIRPIGATPAYGERVALVGYYSGGTFIVNRLVVR